MPRVTWAQNKGREKERNSQQRLCQCTISLWPKNPRGPWCRAQFLRAHRGLGSAALLLCHCRKLTPSSASMLKTVLPANDGNLPDGYDVQGLPLYFLRFSTGDMMTRKKMLEKSEHLEIRHQQKSPTYKAVHCIISLSRHTTLQGQAPPVPPST